MLQQLFCKLLLRISTLSLQNAEQILTVLVLYEVSLQESAAYRSLMAAIGTQNTHGVLFIYDNSSQPQVPPALTSCTIEYVHNPSNPGVSKAYNEAFRFAQRHHFQWLLLVDQDTAFPVDIFDKYAAAREKEPDCVMIVPRLFDSGGMISPFRNRIVTGQRLKRVEAGRQSLEKTGAINSGLLIQTSVFGAAGGYDERLRLDFSDINFCSRLRTHTSYFVVADADCYHSLSSAENINVGQALTRFSTYLEASRTTGESSGYKFLFQAYAIVRALKLSWKYRTLRFLGITFW
jgi:rhamnosyltransferase